jgi:hypothetical protein
MVAKKMPGLQRIEPSYRTWYTSFQFQEVEWPSSTPGERWAAASEHPKHHAESPSHIQAICRLPAAVQVCRGSSPAPCPHLSSGHTCAMWTHHVDTSEMIRDVDTSDSNACHRKERGNLAETRRNLYRETFPGHTWRGCRGCMHMNTCGRRPCDEGHVVALWFRQHVQVVLARHLRTNCLREPGMLCYHTQVQYADDFKCTCLKKVPCASLSLVRMHTNKESNHWNMSIKKNGSPAVASNQHRWHLALRCRAQHCLHMTVHLGSSTTAAAEQQAPTDRRHAHCSYMHVASKCAATAHLASRCCKYAVSCCSTGTSCAVSSPVSFKLMSASLLSSVQ